MANVPTTLNATLIKSLKPKDKNYTVSDTQGLQLLIKTNGTKSWEFRYTSPMTLKRRKAGLGSYPITSLAMARNKRNEYLKLVDIGIDPLEQKQTKKEVLIQDIKQKENTFKKVSLDWLENYKDEVSENYHTKLTRALELYTYSFIGDKPIVDITRLDLIAILQDLKDKNLKETGNRTFMILSKIFMYATMLEIIPHNITADIDKKVILGKIAQKHYPTFTKEKDIKGLLLSIDEYSGDYSTVQALKMLPYVFVRSFNIRHCEWSEIDLKAKLWTIPANKMKIKKEFVMPLPNQVITILKDTKEFTGSYRYVFPSMRANNKPMSDNTMISALRRMGYTKEELVPHSFRSIFSTIAYENMNLKNSDGGHTIQSEVIESLLAHEEQNKVKGAYNRAEYIDAKKELIQWYADYLDGLKNG